MSEQPLINVTNLKMYFPFKDGLFKTKYIKAVDDVSFNINKGETFGLVGESGCGKSTTGRAILRLLTATEGKVYFEDKDIFSLGSKELLRLRKHMQIIFQDPFASLNPKLRVFDIIEEPLKFHGVNSKKERRKVAEEVMETVGLDPNMGRRFPHEFSGGQQQRIGIARALVLKPKFIVCDEAVSALDVSVQAQVLNLLEDLKKDFGLTYLFISHNLSVIKHISDRIGVMYLGKMVEIGTSEQIFKNPLHPYTKALISSIPIPDADKKRNRIILEGDVPSPADPPLGCRFHTRCYSKTVGCDCTQPGLKEIEDGHFVACIRY
jgi:oligopeptide/dipeptide ABC transporter, ATP-binding protein, C-terminal domain